MCEYGYRSARTASLLKAQRASGRGSYRGCESEAAAMVSEVWRAKRAGLFPSKEFAADIRPEFLDNVIEGGRFQLCSPIFRRLAEAALLRRIIEIG